MGETVKRESPEVAAARINVERSRAQLMASAHELQDRLSPRTLARGAWEGAKEKGADLAEDAVDAVRTHPLTAGGIIAAITMFVAREPLMDLAGKLKDNVSDNRGARKARKKQKKTKDTEAVE